MNWKNRIKELREVTAEELKANPLNWRKHPEKQNKVLKGILEEVGIAAPLVAYYSEESEGNLTLIDGHLRLETGGSWPCVILDVNDQEAKLLLSVFDPIGYLAEKDQEILNLLLEQVETTDETLFDFLSDMVELTEEDGEELEEVKTEKETDPFFDDSVVRFTFGDYRGLVDKEIYQTFIEKYQDLQKTTGEVLLSDVLEVWLGI